VWRHYTNRRSTLKIRVLRSNCAAICLLVIAVSSAGGQSTGEDAKSAGQSASEEAKLTEARRSEIRVAVQRMLSGIRSIGDKEFSRLMMPETMAPDEAATVLGRVREIRELLLTPADEPLSELSPPVFTVRAVWLDTSDRASVCVYLVRIGSLMNLRLAAYNVSVVKTKQEWRLTSLSSTGSCEGVGYDPYLVLPLPGTL
jgi:hypothetical protein